MRRFSEYAVAIPCYLHSLTSRGQPIDSASQHVSSGFAVDEDWLRLIPTSVNSMAFNFLSEARLSAAARRDGRSASVLVAAAALPRTPRPPRPASPAPRDGYTTGATTTATTSVDPVTSTALGKAGGDLAASPIATAVDTTTTSDRRSRRVRPPATRCPPWWPRPARRRAPSRSRARQRTSPAPAPDPPPHRCRPRQVRPFGRWAEPGLPGLRSRRKIPSIDLMKRAGALDDAVHLVRPGLQEFRSRPDRLGHAGRKQARPRCTRLGEEHPRRRATPASSTVRCSPRSLRVRSPTASMS